MPPCKNKESCCVIHLLTIQSRVLTFTSYSAEIVCLYWWLHIMILMILWFYPAVKPWGCLGFPPCLCACLLLWPFLEFRLFLDVCGCAHSELRYCLEHSKTLWQCLYAHALAKCDICGYFNHFLQGTKIKDAESCCNIWQNFLLKFSGSYL